MGFRCFIIHVYVNASEQPHLALQEHGWLLVVLTWRDSAQAPAAHLAWVFCHQSGFLLSFLQGVTQTSVMIRWLHCSVFQPVHTLAT